MKPSADRVLVVGLDGATFDVLLPLCDRGVLPNLDRLRRTAGWGVLQSTTPYITPVAWTTFLTGCGPECHHILDFHYLNHPEGVVAANHSGRVRCPTMYQVLSAAGRDVVSLNLPMTTPPPDVRGLVVGGLDSPTDRAAFGPHEEFFQVVRREAPAYTVRPVWRGRPRSLDELKDGLRATGAIFRSRATAARLADERIDWSLMVVQLQNLDCLQHRLWPYLGVGNEEVGSVEWNRAVEAGLHVLDQVVGELLELASRRGAAVAVVSDHGFGPFDAKISISELLLRAGLLKRRSAGRALGDWFQCRMLRLRKWTYRRRWRGASTGLLPRSLQSLGGLDLQHSLALPLHGNLAALIYLNARERFPSGPIAGERQKRGTLARVEETFREARHPETGAAMFEDVFSVAERYGCDPVHEFLPDLMAIPVPGLHAGTKFNAGGALLASDPSLPGTHRREGVLLLDAPGVRPGNRPAADLRDVAPTLLAMLGCSSTHPFPPQAGQPRGGGVTGRVLDEWFERSLTGVECPRSCGHATPAQSEAIHSPPPSRGRVRVGGPTQAQSPDTLMSASPPAPHVYSNEDEQIINDRLSQLGYME